MPLLDVASRHPIDCDPHHERTCIGCYCEVLQKGTAHTPLREVLFSRRRFVTAGARFIRICDGVHDWGLNIRLSVGQ